MFTGIVEELGSVISMERRGEGARLRIGCAAVVGDAFEGASIAVNGVCLTAVALGADGFSADIAPETMARTNLAGLRPGKRVNLERPMTPGGRLGGHIVQGHVDGTGEFLGLTSIGNDNWWLRIGVPEELDRYLVWKGSVAIDGISLTIASMENGVMGVTIIPHTFEKTTLGGYQPGSRVNLETDVLAKYVEKLLRWHGPEKLNVERLKELGY
ncbi:MAG TPA: riboflavin synthase [Bryobacteraceae bacterium]|nr:riboflavin synthase [Bryobacteraceae bacterium]